MKLVKMRLYWSKVGPKANMTGVLMRREKTQRHTQGENHEMLGAETGTMLPQPRKGKDWQCHQQPGERHKTVPPRAFSLHSPANT